MYKLYASWLSIVDAALLVENEMVVEDRLT